MIVAYGDAIVDLFALPLGCDVASAEQFVPRQGGAPANVAVVAARLGAPSRFVGAVGRDAHGERLLHALERAGVDTRSVVSLANRTGVTFVRVGLDGARSFLFYRQAGADFALSREDLESLAASPLEGASWLQVMSSALVVEPKATASRWVLAQAEQRHVPLSFDLNVRAHLWPDAARMNDEVRSLAAQALLVKASEEDLDAIGLPRTLEALRSIATRAGSVAVLTLAERGAVASVADQVIEVPAPAVNVVDATGAGDAFVGSMLAGLTSRAITPGSEAWRDVSKWRPLLALACRVGALAVTAIGATDALLDLAEERAEIQGHRS